jgi:hypothetical protein
VATNEQHLATLTPDTREAVRQLLAYARSLGMDPSILSSFRSCEEQMELYSRGRTAPGAKVTWVPGCRSWHTHGRAVDLYLGTWDEGPYLELGPYWQAMGGRWGGDFGDYGHFEWRPGLTMADVGCPHSEGTCAVPALPAAAMAGVGLAAVGMVVVGWTVGRTLWTP